MCGASLLRLGATTTTRVVFRFSVGLSFGLETWRQRRARYRLPWTTDLDTHFPLVALKAVKVALVEVMAWKAHHNIDTMPPIIDELDAVVLVPIPMCRSMRGRPMSGLSARFPANSLALARDKHEHCTNQTHRR